VNDRPFVCLFTHAPQWDVCRYDAATTANYYTLPWQSLISVQFIGCDTKVLYLQETFVFFQQFILWNLWINQAAATSVLTNSTGRPWTLEHVYVCVRMCVCARTCVCVCACVYVRVFMCVCPNHDVDNCITNGLIAILMVIFGTPKCLFSHH
jgi:hypothetical protein